MTLAKGFSIQVLCVHSFVSQSSKQYKKLLFSRQLQSIMDLAQGQGRAAVYCTQKNNLCVSERDFSDGIFSSQSKMFYFKGKKKS